MSEYSGWALSTIALLMQREDLEADLRCQEALDIIHHKGACFGEFNLDHTPAEAIENIVEAYHDSR